MLKFVIQISRLPIFKPIFLLLLKFILTSKKLKVTRKIYQNLIKKKDLKREENKLLYTSNT
jgi:hypothetical protein